LLAIFISLAGSRFAAEEAAAAAAASRGARYTVPDEPCAAVDAVLLATPPLLDAKT